MLEHFDSFYCNLTILPLVIVVLRIYFLVPLWFQEDCDFS